MAQTTFAKKHDAPGLITFPTWEKNLLPQDIKKTIGATNSKIIYNQNRCIIFTCWDMEVKNKDIGSASWFRQMQFKIALFLPNKMTESMNQTWGMEQTFSAPTLLRAIGDKIIPGVAKKVGHERFGVSRNPAEELMYQGPDPRSFSFSFEFVPVSQTDLDAEISIMYLFKYFSLPEMGTAKAYINTPSLWSIDIIGTKNPLMDFMFTGRYFAITSLNTDYTPDGIYNAFKNGFPVKTEMSINFQEIVPMYKNDPASSQSFNTVNGDMVTKIFQGINWGRID